MTQKSHCWAYTPRNPELKETHVPQGSSLFTIARTWKQPRWPSADEWIRKLWYIYTMEYYSAIKRKAFESVLMRWTNLEPIIQRSKSERERQTLYINTCIWNLERWYWWTYLQGSGGYADLENRLMNTVGEGEFGTNWENSIETYITICKMMASRNLLCDKGSSTQCSVTT